MSEEATPTARKARVSSPAATKKGRRSAEAFRAAAAEVFTERGFLNVTVADIAVRAERSAASFYYHYDSKEDVLLSLFEEFRDSIQAGAQTHFDPGADPRDQIEQLTRNFWVTYRSWLAVLVAVFQLSMVDDEFYLRWRDIRLDAVNSIRSWVRSAQRQGHAMAMDPDLTASALAAMLDGFCFVWLSRDGDRPGVTIDDDAAVHTLSAICYRSLYSAAVD